MDKTILVTQLSAKLKQQAQLAEQVAHDAREDARSGAPRAVNLAKGHAQRLTSIHSALEALEMFRPRPLRKSDPIGLGAVVEVEGGDAGRTLFLAPVGAGEELSGPDGDGIFQVVTPVSPFGKALLGKRVGDEVEIAVAGDTTEWTITYAE